MHRKARIALFCTVALLTAAVIFGSAFAVSRAMGEKAKYIDAERKLAVADLCKALNDMEKAASEGDLSALNFAAGRAEAHLSRAGLEDCGGIYGEIRRICSGEGGEEECARLADAVKRAAEGDGGRALREISGGEIPSNDTDAETTEDLLSSRMLKRLGNSRGDVALRRAQAFACPNAVFDECTTHATSSFAYSGENVFVMVLGETPRVVMYCFDRDTDPRYSVTPEEAERNTEMIIKREKLRLAEKRVTEEKDGLYRIVCYGKDSLSDTPLVTVEIYSDTGRLRLYDAVNYYKYQN